MPPPAHGQRTAPSPGRSVPRLPRTMSVDLRPPVRRRAPPRPRATPGDTLFGVGVAVLFLALTGALLATTGGPLLLAQLGLGSGSAAPTAPPGGATPGPGAPGTTARPLATPASPQSPEPTPAASGEAPSSPEPFTTNLYLDGVFVHQVDKEACVAAAAQNMLNVIRLVEEGREPDTGEATQRAIYDRIVGLTTWDDSHNGGTGPAGWAALLTEEGYPYEVRAYDSRLAAMRAAASALRATGRPVGILAWAGVHSWVLTGFTATADPATARMFTVTTAYVLDPWYPWVSTRWPRSEAPNVPRDQKDLVANVLPWKLASGPYEGRDGKFLLVAPVGG